MVSCPATNPARTTEQGAPHRGPALARCAEATVAHFEPIIAKLRLDRFGASCHRGRKLLDLMGLNSRETEEPEAAAAEDASSAAENDTVVQAFTPGRPEPAGTDPRQQSKREDTVPSQVYDLFSQAMAGRKQVLCRYDGHPRELCPTILGHSKGHEKALTYQFGGQSRSGLPRGGEWRCLWLDKVSDVQLRDGPWYAGNSHTQPQGCVETVDLDVNPASPYNPSRPL